MKSTDQKVAETFSFLGVLRETDKQNRLWADLDDACRGKFGDKLDKAKEEGYNLVTFDFRRCKFKYELSKFSNVWRLIGILPMNW